MRNFINVWEAAEQLSREEHAFTVRTRAGKETAACYAFCTTAAFSAWPTMTCASSSICSRCCWLRKLSA
jgi:hypothetical protein